MVTNSQTAAQRAKNKMLKLSSKKNSEVKEEGVESLFGVGPQIPEPVFFCSIEPPSLAYQTALEQALNELQREDPSLRVTHDSETGQTVLSGADFFFLLNLFLGVCCRNGGITFRNYQRPHFERV